MSEINTIPEILLVDKPYGFTSFDIIRILRKKFQIKKIGHAGTLDPLATGLMIIGLGQGTKQLELLTKLDKVYDTQILLGTKTDSGDLEGNVIESKKVVQISDKEIETILNQCVGILTLPVPIFSAVKVDGKRLYSHGRAGNVDFVTPTRDMQIFSIELLDQHQSEEGYMINIRMHISSGSYVRSIAEEIGRRLGYPATVANLRRIKIGDFDIKDAMKIETDEEGRIKKRSERI